jgi:membrane-associated phospholipid phosphatase
VTTGSMFERRRLALAAGLALLAVAATMTVVVIADRAGSRLQATDDRWLAWMAEHRTPWATTGARVLSVLGGPLVMVPMRLVVIGALAWRRRWLQVGALLGAVVTSELCIGPLKALVDRPRPPGPLAVTDSPSFPSGHAIAASVTAIGLVLVLVPAASTRRTTWTLVAAAFALLMASSRTYLAVHWLSDVVAGACIGTGFAVAWPAALELERERRRTSGPRDGWFAWRRATAVALLVIGGAGVLALHLLRPDLGARTDRISEYAIGRYGPVMAMAFVAIGLALLVMASLVADGGGRWSPGVAAGIGVAGMAMVGAGIWRTDPTRSGVLTDAIHSRASALATVALIAAALAWSVLRHPRPHRVDLAAALAVLAAVLGIVSPVLHDSTWSGLSQRLLWLVILAWSIVTAATLRPRRRPGLSDTSGEPLTMTS